MKTKIAGFVLTFGLAFSAGAQALVDSFVFGFSPRTGDAFVDTQLGDINVFASGNTDGFIDDVVVSFGAPRHLVSEYYLERRWAPGDLYFACAIAYQLGRPCLEIIHIYERDHGQGWGAIAQRLGIKPGSAAFHALKGKVGRGHGKMKAGRGNGGHGARAAGPQGGRSAGPASQGGGRPQGGQGQGGQGKGKGKDKGGR
ncbi:hypothetical protein [Arenimonas terrae]|jgi:hypothetical protein|uniref:Uncharacterized protein n=1 Tax=Arenimonas terrae TaxID=2546226 RepID=A0A5C4RSF6_9GAMM|nr:hypothetical protein [Arenimonas terrae]TNJ33905.1 hypothetical protein E1B00_11290 [Arenimonas terrae]